MATAYKYGFGPLGAAYTGYRMAKPYLYYGSAIAAGIGAAKLRSWYNKRSARNAQRLIGLAGYRPPEKKECIVSDVSVGVVKPSTTTQCNTNLVRIAQGTSKMNELVIRLTCTQFNLMLSSRILQLFLSKLELC